MASFLSPLLANPRTPWVLRSSRTGAVIATRLETAFDSTARNRGLLGRTSLPAGHALVIAPCNGVHTFFMKFTIDALFVARDGRVRRAITGLRPWRIALSPRSYAVVEMSSGALRAADVQSGDTVSIEPA